MRGRLVLVVVLAACAASPAAQVIGPGVHGPSITSLSVSSGAIGASVTLTGTGFNAAQGGGVVTFGNVAGIAGIPATITSWSATSVTVTVPASAITGTVFLFQNGVQSNGLTFTVSSGDVCVTATCFYLDPNATNGTQSGTQAQPWHSLAASQWSSINTALATGDVYLYCSAREAGSDINQSWPVTITIAGNKTANPTGTLIFDGHDQYNTSDASPSWASYSGSSRCAVVAFSSHTTTKYSKVTIDGFVVVQTSSGSKPIEVCGDHWTIKNSDVSMASTVSGTAGSPDILLVPTADSTHEGSSVPCPAMTDITIGPNNDLHDSLGEVIYVGGAGCIAADVTLAAPNCGGFPGHDHITITGNRLYNGGTRGAEGDLIDVKAAVTNLTITGNDFTANGSNARCIVTQGIQTDGTDQANVIERNTFHNCLSVQQGIITFSATWGTPNGWTIRNNLIYGGTGGSAVFSNQSQSSPGIIVDNNTIYNNSGSCISGSSTTWTVKNNACLANNGSGAQVSLGGTVSSSTNNAYGGSWSATCTSCVSGLTTAAFTNAATGDFTLAGSALKSVGTDLSATFTNDYAGATRVAPWDIGAYAR